MLHTSTLVLLALVPLRLVLADATCYEGAKMALHAHCYGVMINMNFDAIILEKRNMQGGDLLGQLNACCDACASAPSCTSFTITDSICHLQNATVSPTPLLGAVVGRYKVVKS
ncbi:hypothetical protein SDRG_08785 [Saprolegnia diclina VS20]|uniref:Apple domain-containing protein n=1 Tax=Saprolegnia diclina (strain VS20) TaxID=1156394 RepID=T0QG13_SAPDV|nr:hypothetical protein SDRG_08785 [Saprolegnia diclina VS20]EQC33681.1 hypothetical protein SDRG_08785 [Saprolegnia diclina VS20]|eukprot:XP_008612904.1 hypothetical protein SDRG_08785 [Saprolegnia diclina VS20]